MGCYWGCDTKSNRIVWGIVAFMMVTGAVLAIAGGIAGSTGSKCFQQYNDCYKAISDRGQCSDLAQASCHYKTYTSLIFAGVVIFLAGGLGPLSYFCCCADPPNKQAGSVYPNRNDNVAVAVVVTQPVPPPYYAPPPPGQPYYPPPPQAQPYPPPPMGQPYYPPPPELQQPHPSPPPPQQPQPVMAQPFDPATMKMA